MKLLLGVFNMDEEEARMFVDMANEAGARIDTYACRYSKLGVERCIEENPDISIAILSESLETNSPYEVKDFERLIDIRDKLIIIPILNNNSYGTEKLRGLFQLGIYTGIYSKDASAEAVAKMIVEGRTRKYAKSYYHFSDLGGIPDGPNMDMCVAYIMDGDDDEVVERASWVRERVLHSDFLMIKERLPVETQTIIEKGMPELRGVLLSDPEMQKGALEDDGVSKRKTGLSVISEILKKTQEQFAAHLYREEREKRKEDIPAEDNEFDEESAQEAFFLPDHLTDILYNVAIGFVGVQRKCGVTHQAIITANYLSANGYRVAFADFTPTKGKTLNSIAKYRDVKWHGKYFTIRKVDYYPDIAKEFGIVLANPKHYHFIVIDYGVYNTSVRNDISRCSKKFVVAGSALWEKGQILSFVKEVNRMKDEFFYLIRGVPEEERENQPWLEGLVSNYGFVDVANDPFSGECYPALEMVLSVYTGKPNRNQTKSILEELESGNERRNGEKSLKDVVGTAVCFVTSLKHGCGSSHFATAAANYLSRNGYEVCMVAKSVEDIEAYVDENVVLVKNDHDYANQFSSNQYIIFDGGVYGELETDKLEELKRADHRILLCWPDERYLEKLAEFIAGHADAEEWVYVFNNVPEGKIRSIKRLMNLYFSVYLPVYDTSELPKDVKRIMKEIFS